MGHGRPDKPASTTAHPAPDRNLALDLVRVTEAAAMAAGRWVGLGGVIQARLSPRDDSERARALAAGHDLSRVLTTEDLVAGDEAYFAATGVTDGQLLRGVRYGRRAATTESLVMRARSGTVRFVISEHNLGRLGTYSLVDYRQLAGRSDAGARPEGDHVG